MVLVSRDELQQLIGASGGARLRNTNVVNSQDTSEYYTIRQLAEKWGEHSDHLAARELGHIKGYDRIDGVLFL